MKPIKFACAVALIATTANAQEAAPVSETALTSEVVLTSNDGGVSLRGRLIEFSDQKYTIETLVGTLVVDSVDIICTGEECPVVKPPVSEFRLEGSGALGSSLMTALLPGYAKSLDGYVSTLDGSNAETVTVANSEGEALAKISLTDASSTEILENLSQGKTAIALTSRQIRSDEASVFEEDGIAIQSPEHEQVIGLDAIAIVTAKDNPLDSISVRDAALVFSGTYSNWSELGGMDAPIKLYGPPADSELANSFITGVIESQEDDISGLSQELVAIEDVADNVSSDPNGIGYTYFSTSLPAKTLAIRAVCGLEVPVDDFTIKAEEYPLTKRFYAYSSNEQGKPHVDDLLRFLQSDTGQAIAGSHGLIDLRGISSAVSDQGMRFANAIASSDNGTSGELLREMVSQIIDSERLSNTIRFETGSNQMGQRAMADINRLAEKLRSKENVGSEVRLLGFTDSIGDFELNQELSLRRANLVRNALLEIDSTLVDRVTIQAEGFGEIAPIGCNETAFGRSANRRVEVWMGKPEALAAQ